MGGTIRARAGAAGVLAMVLLLVAGAVAGCSSGGTAGSSTTTAKGSTVTTTGTGVSNAATPGSTNVVVDNSAKEKYQAALPDLEAKAKAAPGDFTALLDLAVAYYNLDRFQDAASLYEQMLKLGEDPMLRNNYGNTLRDMGKTEEAEAAYRKALEEDPKLVVAYVNLASLLARGGSKDEAFKVLDEGIAKLEGADKTRLEKVKTALQKAK